VFVVHWAVVFGTRVVDPQQIAQLEHLGVTFTAPLSKEQKALLNEVFDAMKAPVCQPAVATTPDHTLHDTLTPSKVGPIAASELPLATVRTRL
jgi:hypothetical protein